MKLDFDCPHCKKDITLDSEKLDIIDPSYPVHLKPQVSVFIVQVLVIFNPQVL